MRKCSCGSKYDAEAQFDGYDIFLCYTCKICHNEKMQRYRRDIMSDEPIDED